MKKPEALVLAEDYIAANYRLPINTRDVCKHARSPFFKLYYIFKKRHGHTIKQHIFNLRIQEAARLMKENKFSLEGIREHVGFTCHKSLVRGTRQHFNLGPKQLRKQLLAA